uniref:Uncharacterized protein n=1 Tax=Amphimedon queenslandica TaxID=400682 RepID=A0A1X7VFM0_AMPQE
MLEELDEFTTEQKIDENKVITHLKSNKSITSFWEGLRIADELMAILLDLLLQEYIKFRIFSDTNKIMEQYRLKEKPPFRKRKVFVEIDKMINKYPKLKTLKLDDCLVYGEKENPPLPAGTLMELKQKLLGLFHPRDISTKVEFEPYWFKCIQAMNHLSFGRRSKYPSDIKSLE